MIESLESLLRIVEVALGIGLVIFVHELGHFLVAKKVGIRVDVFSLGFGRRLVGFRRGTTDYRISAIPLGGYVKMAGENPDEEPTGSSDEFTSKSVGARSAVIVAGVCMNAVFAVLGFLAAFKIGVQMDAPAVGRVQPGSAAEAAGLRYGDRVVALDGERPLEFLDLGLAAAYASGDLEMVVDRRGTQHTVRVSPRKAIGSPVQQLGFERMDAVATVAPGSAGEKAGVRPGDWLLSVDGKPLGSRFDFTSAVRSSPGRPLAVEVRRGEAVEKLVLTPASSPARTYGVRLAPVPVVGKVVPGSPAEQAGVRAGDQIVAIGGAPADVRTFRDRVAETKPGEALKFTLRRGARESLDVSIAPRHDPAAGSRPVIGIVFGAAVIGEVTPGSPAAQAGLAPGDRIAKFQDEPAPAIFGDVDQLEEFANLADARKQPLDLTIESAGAAESRTVKLEPVIAATGELGEAGVEFAPATFLQRVPGVVEPVRLGLERTWMFIEQVFMTFQGMFARRIDPSTLGGPIGIAETAYRVSEYGVGKLLYFLAIISVNLAVLNILPIPILDGGHLVFLALEKVKGRAVEPRVQAAAQWVGLAVLLMLMIFVTFNDIRRTFFGG